MGDWVGGEFGAVWGFGWGKFGAVWGCGLGDFGAVGGGFVAVWGFGWGGIVGVSLGGCGVGNSLYLFSVGGGVSLPC